MLPKCANSSIEGLLTDDRLMSLWTTFCQIIVDTYFPLYGPDIAQFKVVIRKSFPKFARPVTDGSVAIPATSKAGWFELYKLHQPLLSSEELIANSLLNKGGVSENGYLDMPILSKYLLCAAYLASYNKPKNDVKLFSRIRESRKRQRNSFHRKFKDKVSFY